jgi:pyruvate kinase
LAVRRINKVYGRAIKILQDLEGQRIRIGGIKKEILLEKGKVFFLIQTPSTGSSGEVNFDYQGSLRCVRPGMRVFIDDGKITLLVKAVEKRRIKTQVLAGGVLKEHKGVNIPDAKLDFDEITEKDKADLEFGIRNKVDFIAQSFVNTAKDIRLVRQIVRYGLPRCRLFAKIESKDGLRNLDDIIRVSDGILIARGDLGVCLPIYEVAIIQKEIVKRCRLLRKPVMVATQMLDSMTEELTPTRAEVSDVSNAILDGVDYCLLSSETAVGKHPDKGVGMMNTIIKYTELYERNQFKPLMIDKRVS